MRKVILLIMVVLVLTACSSKQLPKVETKDSLVITVNIKDGTLSFINMESGKNFAQWNMGKPYTGGIMLPDGDSILLYGKELGSVDIYTLSNGKKKASWNTGKGIVSGKLLSNGKEIVFADQSEPSLRLYSTEGKELGKLHVKKNPLQLVEDDKNRRLYVLSFDSDNLVVIDLEKFSQIQNFSIHGHAAGALLLDEGREIWIGGHGDGMEPEMNIHVYSTATGKLLKNVTAPLMPINFATKDGYVFSLSHGSNALYQMDLNGEILKKLTISSNPFEIKVHDNYLIIAGYDSNDVHFLDYRTMEIKQIVQVGKGPFQVIIRERIKDEQN